jgi:hypothetical protein
MGNASDCSASGVFLDFSYIPPPSTPEAIASTSTSTVASTFSIPSHNKSQAYLLMLISRAAQKRGGFPSWLGNWYGNAVSSPPPDDTGSSGGVSKVPGNVDDVETPAGEAEASTMRRSAMDWIVARLGKDQSGVEVRDGDGAKVLGKAGALGNGRCWVVRGRQWTEVGEGAVLLPFPYSSGRDAAPHRT